MLNPFFTVFEPGLDVWGGFSAQNGSNLPKTGLKYVQTWGSLGVFLRKITFGPILRAPLMPQGPRPLFFPYFSPYLQLAWALGRLVWPRWGLRGEKSAPFPPKPPCSSAVRLHPVRQPRGNPPPAGTLLPTACRLAHIHPPLRPPGSKWFDSGPVPFF